MRLMMVHNRDWDFCDKQTIDNLLYIFKDINTDDVFTKYINYIRENEKYISCMISKTFNRNRYHTTLLFFDTRKNIKNNKLFGPKGCFKLLRDKTESFEWNYNVSNFIDLAICDIKTTKITKLQFVFSLEDDITK
jgi:hypothetical protein